MKTRTIYVADDGKEFKTQEECIEYDKRAVLREFFATHFRDYDEDTRDKYGPDALAKAFLEHFIVAKLRREE